MKNILVATIMGDMGAESDRRIRLVLRRDGVGYQWIEEETGADTGPLAKSIAEAKDNAIAMWGPRGNWQLKATWLKE